MTSSPKWRRLWRQPDLDLSLALLLSAGFIFKATATPQNPVEHYYNTTIPTEFPLSKPMERNERVRVTFTVTPPFGQAYSLRIIPDDCAEELQINGQQLPVRRYPDRCNYSSGFVLNTDTIAAYTGNSAKNSATEFEIEVRNNGGPGGINIMVIPDFSWLILLANIMLFGSVMGLIWQILRRRRTPIPLALVLILGVALRLWFFMQIPYTSYAYDVDGHVQYVSLMAEKRAIPADDDCWTCYHPPVYYGISQIFWQGAKIFGATGTQMLQLQSLLLSLLALLLGYGVLRQILQGKALFWAALLWSFWPTAILSAPRIGNDQLFYVLHITALGFNLHYLLQGDNSKRGRYLLGAVLFSALAYLTKSTGVVAVGLTALTLLLGYFPRIKWRPSTSEAIALALGGLMLLALVVSKLVGSDALVGNASSLHKGLQVGNNPGNYVFFDFKDYFTNPYPSPWEDAGGRQYFWNYLFKTALFGEFRLLRSQAGYWLASLISLSFLGLVVLALRGWWRTATSRVTLVLCAQGLAFVAALLFLRMQIPFACSNDFRYIFPILLSFIPAVALGMPRVDSCRKARYLLPLIPLLFTLASAILLLSL